MSETSFSDLNLDARLLKAISTLGWHSPSSVQAEAIPLSLQGKDVIVRAKTGSGKTAAYLLPLMHKILTRHQISSEHNHSLIGLILSPSKELCKQAHRNATELGAYCSKIVVAVDLANSSVQHASSLMSNCDFVISTPSKLLAHINNKSISLAFLEYLVIDEADLMFSYGYENDLRELVTNLPKIYQAILVSATISQDVDSLRNLILHNPVLLKLKESDLPESDTLMQYVVTCEAPDKYLIVYSLLKLNLVRGKTLIFVNTLERCYRLKLFLEQFYIKSCVLNSELPQNSRLHIVEEFNRGVYDIVIATDVSAAIDSETKPVKRQAVVRGKKKKHKTGDPEFNVSRGIDFQEVDNVLNFDFPTSVNAYVHRVGRTARGGHTGTALSLIASEDDKKVVKAIESKLAATFGSSVLKPYNFKMEQVEGFRYRVVDAVASITKVKVKEARLREIKGELFASEKLKSYFADNPKDLNVLRHDKVLAPASQRPELKHVPDYLVPETLKHVMLKPRRKRKRFAQSLGTNKKSKLQNEDPLKSFKFKKRNPAK